MNPTQNDMVRKEFQRGHNWDDRVTRIENDLADIKSTLDFIKNIAVNDTAMLAKADATIATIAGEVKPTLDALTSNPAVRMFLGVKKGDKL